jgi:hypothetical protein
MLIRLSLVFAIFTLTGCVSKDIQSFHQETLSAIYRSEANITQRLTNLELQSAYQTEDISSLKTQATNLKQQVRQLTQRVQHLQAKKVRKTSGEVEESELITEPVPANKIILGRVEHVMIDSIKRKYIARIDTGAAISSLNAVDVEEFERNGEDWVRFHLSKPQKNGLNNHWVEAPILKHVKIKQASSKETERRIVVELWVTVGKIHERTEFTLADRSKMSYSVLLGREFIRDIALVDVSRKFVQSSMK